MKHPHKDLNRRVAVAGCKHTTRELITGLARRGFTVDHCITISPEKAAQQQVAGYEDLRPFLDEQQIPWTHAHKYSLKSAQDRQTIGALNLDLLLVNGWQRLIPEWFLKQLELGAFGMHGSNKPLPHGRGRSPMNWSLIQGKNLFFTHLFRYAVGVDDGPIIAVQKFSITPHDTCLTLHYKNTLSMIALCADALPKLMDGSAKSRPQPDGPASFYPKRGAEDGLIYWNDAAADIFNLIRAVTRPFPGAFCYLDDDPQHKLMIWRAIPFDDHLDFSHAQAGQILEVFSNGDTLVKCGDTCLLLQDYEGLTLNAQHVGRRLGHLDTPRKSWPDLPR